MTEYYDALETQDPEAREAALFCGLRDNLARAQDALPGWAKLLGGVDPQAVRDRAALAGLPVLRKSEIARLQAETPPLGGLAADRLPHLFMSPGPIFEPGGKGRDWWRMGRALYAAGLRAGDLAHNCFAYHQTPAGMMMENGAEAVGARVFPGGIGNTDAQIQAAAQLRPDAYVGTPDFLKVMLDKAQEAGADLSSIRKAMVSGGALFPSLRSEYAGRGVAVLQCYATADLGLIAYESPAQEGMIVGEGVIVEILRPGTGDPVAEGEVGEVVVTSLNPDYPLFRFATGDLSAVLPGISPCGRTNMRIKGWMGRADQTAKIKGMFVRPEQIAAVLARHPEAQKARLTVTRIGEQDAFHIDVEAAPRAPELADAIAATAQSILKLRVDLRLQTPGFLPNDGKVIDDQRSYD